MGGIVTGTNDRFTSFIGHQRNSSGCACCGSAAASIPAGSMTALSTDLT